MRELEKQLAGTSLAPEERFRLLMKMTWERIREGQTVGAVADVEEGIKLLEGFRRSMPPSPRLTQLAANAQRLRALAYLRHAETRNCVARHTSESCILPISARGVHQEKEPARQARASLEEYLRLKPDDLGAVWILNLVNMTLGENPGGVPPEMRISFDLFQSDHPIGRFIDIASDLGINTVDLAGGVIVEDLDQDGFLDIVTSSSDPERAVTLYRNLGTGSFKDITAGTGLDQQFGGLNIVAADYDNDSDTDLLVLRGGWLYEEGKIRKSLMRNDGDGIFTDVTRSAGLAEPYPTQAAVWGDFDNDGDLDLYVGNEISGDAERPGPAYPSQLFLNNGDGTFKDAAREAGVANDLQAKGVAAGDYDNDGDLDLYVSNIGRNRLYRNNADGTFTDVAPELGATHPEGRSFAAWFFDYDNDGWLDLWVPAYDATVDDLAADHLGRPHGASLPRLYHNDGHGAFTDRAALMGLAHPYLPMGANFGDLDNDGWLDIYLGTGSPDLWALMPNVMLRNDRGVSYQDVTNAGGFGHLQKGHGIAFADLDNDGDQDIYHQLGGFYPGDRFGNTLFLNPGHGGRYLTIRLVGVESVRSAVGARVALRLATPDGPRQIHRAVGCVSSFGGSPTGRQEIGLASASQVKELEVWWPRTGRRQVFRDLPMDEQIVLVEGSSQVHREPLKRISFAPARPARAAGASGDGRAGP